MRFIFRAIFWLAVVSVFMPAREDAPAVPQISSREIIDTALDYCARNAETCAATARAGADMLRIPPGFIEQAQKVAAEPSRRPASL